MVRSFRFSIIVLITYPAMTRGFSPFSVSTYLAFSSSCYMCLLNSTWLNVWEIRDDPCWLSSMTNDASAFLAAQMRPYFCPKSDWERAKAILWTVHQPKRRGKKSLIRVPLSGVRNPFFASMRILPLVINDVSSYVLISLLPSRLYWKCC